MAKHIIIPVLTPDEFPISLSSEWVENFRTSFTEGKALRVNQAIRDSIDYKEKIGIVSSDNSDGGEVFSATPKNSGLTGPATEMRQRSNQLKAPTAKKYLRAIRSFQESIGNPNGAFQRSIRKGQINLDDFGKNFISSKSLGVPGIPLVAAAGAEFLANIQTWKTKVPDNARPLEDDEVSKINLTLRKTFLAAVVPATTQSLSIALTALLAGIDEAALGIVITELNLRLRRSSTAFAAAGITVNDFNVVAAPQLGLEVRATP